MFRLINIVLFMVMALVTFAQELVTDATVDTLKQVLPELVISGRQQSDAMPDSWRGQVLWNVDALAKLPQIMGNADPMRYTQMLPGVQTNNEYDNGLHIYGCDNTHNMVSIEGVPIYNANHLLGLFSTFNPSHFHKLTVTKTANEASFPNRLGGMVEMAVPSTLTDSLCGELSVGLISSQGTLRMPLGSKSTLIISGRGSYLNLLYGYALKYEGSQMRYSFADANVTWQWHPDSLNRVCVNAYWGNDNSSLDEDRYQAKLKLQWGNIMMSSHWEHQFSKSSQMHHTIYLSRYANHFSLDYPAFYLVLPSSIVDGGYHGMWKGRYVKTGFDMALCRVNPQSPSVMGSYNTHNTGDIEPLDVQEYSTYVDVLIPLWVGASLHAGLRGTLYVDDDRYCHWFIDPSLSLTMTGYNWECSLTACTRHQNLYQTGCSSMGLPTEFWLPADREIRPQQALNLSATLGIPIPSIGLKIDIETYYKKMNSIVEYVGTLLDFINTSYTHNAHLFQGRGNNYGVSIMVSKIRGRLSGWVSYSLGRSLRRFDHESLQGQFPANHERIHEFKALASYELSKHWTLSGTLICASGTPFTEVNHLYLYAGHVITNYGDYNAGRLKPYMRLDLSATYKWSMRGRREQGINLSVYNALCNKNELFKSWKITDDREIIYRPVSFLVRMMPSVSYYVKF